MKDFAAVWSRTGDLRKKWGYTSDQGVEKLAKGKNKRLRGIHIATPFAKDGDWVFPPEEVERLDQENKAHLAELIQFANENVSHLPHPVTTQEELLALIKDWPDVKYLAEHSKFHPNLISRLFKQGMIIGKKVNLLGVTKIRGWKTSSRIAEAWLRTPDVDAPKKSQPPEMRGASLGERFTLRVQEIRKFSEPDLIAKPTDDYAKQIVFEENDDEFERFEAFAGRVSQEFLATEPDDIWIIPHHQDPKTVDPKIYHDFDFLIARDGFPIFIQKITQQNHADLFQAIFPKLDRPEARRLAIRFPHRVNPDYYLVLPEGWNPDSIWEGLPLEIQVEKYLPNDSSKPDLLKHSQSKKFKSLEIGLAGSRGAQADPEKESSALAIAQSIEALIQKNKKQLLESEDLYPDGVRFKLEGKNLIPDHAMATVQYQLTSRTKGPGRPTSFFYNLEFSFSHPYSSDGLRLIMKRLRDLLKQDIPDLNLHPFDRAIEETGQSLGKQRVTFQVDRDRYFASIKIDFNIFSVKQRLMVFDIDSPKKQIEKLFDEYFRAMNLSAEKVRRYVLFVSDVYVGLGAEVVTTTHPKQPSTTFLLIPFEKYKAVSPTLFEVARKTVPGAGFWGAFPLFTAILKNVIPLYREAMKIKGDLHWVILDTGNKKYHLERPNLGKKFNPVTLKEFTVSISDSGKKTLKAKSLGEIEDLYGGEKEISLPSELEMIEILIEAERLFEAGAIDQAAAQLKTFEDLRKTKEVPVPAEALRLKGLILAKRKDLKGAITAFDAAISEVESLIDTQEKARQKLKVDDIDALLASNNMIDDLKEFLQKLLRNRRELQSGRGSSLGNPFILKKGLGPVRFEKNGRVVTFTPQALDALADMVSFARNLGVELAADCVLEDDGTVSRVFYPKDEQKIAVVRTNLPPSVYMNNQNFYLAATSYLRLVRFALLDTDETEEELKGNFMHRLGILRGLLLEHQTWINLYSKSQNGRMDVDAPYLDRFAKEFESRSWGEIRASSFAEDLLPLEAMATEWWGSTPMFESEEIPEDKPIINIHNHPNKIPSPISDSDMLVGKFFGGDINGLILDTSRGQEFFLFHETDETNKDRYFDIFNRFWDKQEGEGVLPDLRALAMRAESGASLGLETNAFETPGERIPVQDLLFKTKSSQMWKFAKARPSGMNPEKSSALLQRVNPRHEDKIVFYPGSGPDAIRPLLATDANRFVFVDALITEKTGAAEFIPQIIADILLLAGENSSVRLEKYAENKYKVSFEYQGRLREIVLYLKQHADSLWPVELERGLDIAFFHGYSADDRPALALNILRYLKVGGFLMEPAQARGGRFQGTYIGLDPGFLGLEIQNRERGIFVKRANPSPEAFQKSAEILMEEHLKREKLNFLWFVLRLKSQKHFRTLRPEINPVAGQLSIYDRLNLDRVEWSGLKKYFEALPENKKQEFRIRFDTLWNKYQTFISSEVFQTYFRELETWVLAVRAKLAHYIFRSPLSVDQTAMLNVVSESFPDYDFSRERDELDRLNELAEDVLAKTKEIFGEGIAEEGKSLGAVTPLIDVLGDGSQLVTQRAKGRWATTLYDPNGNSVSTFAVFTRDRGFSDKVHDWLLASGNVPHPWVGAFHYDPDLALDAGEELQVPLSYNSAVVERAIRAANLDFKILIGNMESYRLARLLRWFADPRDYSIELNPFHIEDFDLLVKIVLSPPDDYMTPSLLEFYREELSRILLARAEALAKDPDNPLLGYLFDTESDIGTFLTRHGLDEEHPLRHELVAEAAGLYRKRETVLREQGEITSGASLGLPAGQAGAKEVQFTNPDFPDEKVRKSMEQHFRSATIYKSVNQVTIERLAQPNGKPSSKIKVAFLMADAHPFDLEADLDKSTFLSDIRDQFKKKLEETRAPPASALSFGITRRQLVAAVLGVGALGFAVRELARSSSTKVPVIPTSPPVPTPVLSTPAPVSTQVSPMGRSILAKYPVLIPPRITAAEKQGDDLKPQEMTDEIRRANHLVPVYSQHFYAEDFEGTRAHLNGILNRLGPNRSMPSLVRLKELGAGGSLKFPADDFWVKHPELVNQFRSGEGVDWMRFVLDQRQEAVLLKYFDEVLSPWIHPNETIEDKAARGLIAFNQGVTNEYLKTWEDYAVKNGIPTFQEWSPLPSSLYHTRWDAYQVLAEQLFFFSDEILPLTYIRAGIENGLAGDLRRDYAVKRRLEGIFKNRVGRTTILPRGSAHSSALEILRQGRNFSIDDRDVFTDQAGLVRRDLYAGYIHEEALAESREITEKSLEAFLITMITPKLAPKTTAPFVEAHKIFEAVRNKEGILPWFRRMRQGRLTPSFIHPDAARDRVWDSLIQEGYVDSRFGTAGTGGRSLGKQTEGQSLGAKEVQFTNPDFPDEKVRESMKQHFRSATIYDPVKKVTIERLMQDGKPTSRIEVTFTLADDQDWTTQVDLENPHYLSEIKKFFKNKIEESASTLRAPPRKKKWILTTLALIAALGFIAIPKLIQKPSDTQFSQSESETHFLAIYAPHGHPNDLDKIFEHIRKEKKLASVDPATGRKKILVIAEGVMDLNSVLETLSQYDKPAYDRLIKESEGQLYKLVFSRPLIELMKGAYAIKLEANRKQMEENFTHGVPLNPDFREDLSHSFNGYLLRLLEFMQQEKIFSMYEEPSFDAWLAHEQSQYWHRHMLLILERGKPGDLDQFMLEADRQVVLMEQSARQRDVALQQLIRRIALNHQGWRIVTLRGTAHAMNHAVIGDLPGVKTAQIVGVEAADERSAFEEAFEMIQKGKSLTNAVKIKAVIEEALIKMRLGKVGNANEAIRFANKVFGDIEQKEGLEKWFERIVKQFNKQQDKDIGLHIQNKLIEEGYVRQEEVQVQGRSLGEKEVTFTNPDFPDEKVRESMKQHFRSATIYDPVKKVTIERLVADGKPSSKIEVTFTLTNDQDWTTQVDLENPHYLSEIKKFFKTKLDESKKAPRAPPKRGRKILFALVPVVALGLFAVGKFVQNRSSIQTSQSESQNHFLVVYGAHIHPNDLKVALKEIEKQVEIAPVDPASGRKKVMVVLEATIDLDSVVEHASLIDRQAYQQLKFQAALNPESVLDSKSTEDLLRKAYARTLESSRRYKEMLFEKQGPLAPNIQQHLEACDPYTRKSYEELRRLGVLAVDEELSFDAWRGALRSYFAGSSRMLNSLIRHDFGQFKQDIDHVIQLNARSANLRDDELRRFVQNLGEKRPGWHFVTLRGFTHFRNDSKRIRNLRGFKTDRVTAFDAAYRDPIMKAEELVESGNPIPYELKIEIVLKLILMEPRVPKTDDTREAYRFSDQVIGKIQTKEGLTVWLERVVNQFEGQDRLALVRHLQNALVRDGYIQSDDIVMQGQSLGSAEEEEDRSSQPEPDMDVIPVRETFVRSDGEPMSTVRNVFINVEGSGRQVRFIFDHSDYASEEVIVRPLIRSHRFSKENILTHATGEIVLMTDSLPESSDPIPQVYLLKKDSGRGKYHIESRINPGAEDLFALAIKEYVSIRDSGLADRSIIRRRIEARLSSPHLGVKKKEGVLLPPGLIDYELLESEKKIKLIFEDRVRIYDQNLNFLEEKISRPDENGKPSGSSLGKVEDQAWRASRNAENLSRQGKFREVLDVLDDAIAHYPDDTVLWTQKAKAHRGLGQLEEAREAIEAAERTNFLDDQTYFVMAQIKLDLGGEKNFREALAAINHAIYLNPIAVQNYAVKIQILRKQRRFQEAFELVKWAMDQWPRDVKFVGQKAGVLEDMGNLEAAIRVMRKGLQMDPNDLKGFLILADLWRNRARLSAQPNDKGVQYHQSLQAIDRAIHLAKKFDQDDEKFFFFKAELHQEMGLARKGESIAQIARRLRYHASSLGDRARETQQWIRTIRDFWRAHLGSLSFETLEVENERFRDVFSLNRGKMDLRTRLETIRQLFITAFSALRRDLPKTEEIDFSDVADLILSRAIEQLDRGESASLLDLERGLFLELGWEVGEASDPSGKYTGSFSEGWREVFFRHIQKNEPGRFSLRGGGFHLEGDRFTGIVEPTLDHGLKFYTLSGKVYEFNAKDAEKSGDGKSLGEDPINEQEDESDLGYIQRESGRVPENVPKDYRKRGEYSWRSLREVPDLWRGTDVRQARAFHVPEDRKYIPGHGLSAIVFPRKEEGFNQALYERLMAELKKTKAARAGKIKILPSPHHTLHSFAWGKPQSIDPALMKTARDQMAFGARITQPFELHGMGINANPSRAKLYIELIPDEKYLETFRHLFGQEIPPPFILTLSFAAIVEKLTGEEQKGLIDFVDRWREADFGRMKMKDVHLIHHADHEANQRSDEWVFSLEGGEGVERLNALGQLIDEGTRFWRAHSEEIPAIWLTPAIGNSVKRLMEILEKRSKRMMSIHDIRDIERVALAIQEFLTASMFERPIKIGEEFREKLETISNAASEIVHQGFSIEPKRDGNSLGTKAELAQAALQGAVSELYKLWSDPKNRKYIDLIQKKLEEARQTVEPPLFETYESVLSELRELAVHFQGIPAIDRMTFLLEKEMDAYDRVMFREGPGSSNDPAVIFDREVLDRLLEISKLADEIAKIEYPRTEWERLKRANGRPTNIQFRLSSKRRSASLKVPVGATASGESVLKRLRLKNDRFSRSVSMGEDGKIRFLTLSGRTYWVKVDPKTGFHASGFEEKTKNGASLGTQFAVQLTPEDENLLEVVIENYAQVGRNFSGVLAVFSQVADRALAPGDEAILGKLFNLLIGDVFASEGPGLPRRPFGAPRNDGADQLWKNFLKKTIQTRLPEFPVGVAVTEDVVLRNQSASDLLESLRPGDRVLVVLKPETDEKLLARFRKEALAKKIDVRTEIMTPTAIAQVLSQNLGKMKSRYSIELENDSISIPELKKKILRSASLA